MTVTGTVDGGAGNVVTGVAMFGGKGSTADKGSKG